MRRKPVMSDNNQIETCNPEYLTADIMQSLVLQSANSISFICGLMGRIFNVNIFDILCSGLVDVCGIMYFGIKEISDYVPAC